MIRVRVLRPTVGDGGRPLEVGEQLVLADSEARALIALGKAEPILNGPDTHDPSLDDAAPVPTHRDPAPTRARGRR